MTDRVIIFDTTLRDGEQALKASLTVKEKLQIALALERLGVDVMEVGFPVSSQGDFESVTGEIKALKEACGDKILKVIIETCYLTDSEKVALCKCVTEGGADYIKTSTGFGSSGASIEDIQLFKKYIGPNVKIKAAGGIRSISDMKAYIAEGCSRIGASAAVELLKDHLDEEV